MAYSDGRCYADITTRPGKVGSSEAETPFREIFARKSTIGMFYKLVCGESVISNSETPDEITDK